MSSVAFKHLYDCSENDKGLYAISARFFVPDDKPGGSNAIKFYYDKNKLFVNIESEDSNITDINFNIDIKELEKLKTFLKDINLALSIKEESIISEIFSSNLVTFRTIHDLKFSVGVRHINIDIRENGSLTTFFEDVTMFIIMKETAISKDVKLPKLYSKIPVDKQLPPISSKDIELLNILGPHYVKGDDDGDYIKFTIELNGMEWYKNFFTGEEKDLVNFIQEKMQEPLQYNGRVFILSTQSSTYYLTKKEKLIYLYTPIKQKILLWNKKDKTTPQTIFSKAISSFAVNKNRRSLVSFSFDGYEGEYPILTVDIQDD